MDPITAAAVGVTIATALIRAGTELAKTLQASGGLTEEQKQQIRDVSAILTDSIKEHLEIPQPPER